TRLATRSWLRWRKRRSPRRWLPIPEFIPPRPAGIYNEVEFPTASAYGYTPAAAARGWFFLRPPFFLCDLCGQKPLTAEVARDVQRSPRKTAPEGAGGNARASRSLQDHWKGNGRRIFAPACSLL